VVVEKWYPQKIYRGAPKRATASNWLGFLGSFSGEYLDASLMPEIQVDLTLDCDGHCVSDYIGSPSATYSLSEIYATVETLQFPAYSRALYELLAAGGSLSCCFKDYTVNTFPGSAGNVEHQFSVHGSVVEMVHFTRYVSNSTAKQLWTNNHEWAVSQYFQSYVDGITGLQLALPSGVLLPPYEIGTAYMLQHTLREWGVLSNTQAYDNMIACDDQGLESGFSYQNSAFIVSWNLGSPYAQGQKTMSGISTDGGSQTWVVRRTGGFSTFFDQILVERRAFLTINPGKVFSVSV